MSTTSLPPYVTTEFTSQSSDDFDLIRVCHASNKECFLQLCTRCYPIRGGRSESTMIPKSLVLDACRILTGSYQEEVHLYDVNNDRIAEEELLRPGKYLFKIMVEIGSSEEKSDYGVYTSFHTWRPPTRDEVPSHWFTASSPKVVPSTRPAWARRSMGHRADMRSYMSEKAKTSDEFVCSLTRVESTTVKGGHAVPVDEKVFVSLISLFDNFYCISDEHSMRNVN